MFHFIAKIFLKFFLGYSKAPGQPLGSTWSYVSYIYDTGGTQKSK